MRNLVSFVIPLALVASPLSVSAQGTDKGWAEEFYPELAPKERPQAPPPEQAPEEPATEPAPADPSLQLRLDDAGVEVAPGYPPSFVEIERRMKKARVGLLVSAGVLSVGFVMGLAAAGGGVCYGAEDPSSCPDPWVAPVGATGAVLFVGGLAGVIASGVMRRKRERELRRLEDEYYRTRRPAQWDVARSRLAF